MTETPGLEAHFPAPDVPFGGDYAERHRAFVDAVLTVDALIGPFRSGDELPTGFGVGLDERVVEYPWLFAQEPAGHILDAGSVLNHAHILDRFLPLVKSLTITTLEPEPVSFVERGISYTFSDLRDLPFRDRSFDSVVCLSTLEHVGMDNTAYGSQVAAAADADAAVAAAVAELRRVLRPGGRLLVSVPFGAFEDHGWFRQFGGAELARLVELLEPAHVVLDVFRYAPNGWRRSDPAAAGSVRYRLPTAPAAADKAAAARAVACLVARFPEA